MPDDRPVIIVSACLMGVRCRWDGGSNETDALAALEGRVHMVPVCPEQLGGLPTPRPPAERQGGRVITADGRDVTAAFCRGAAETGAIVRRLGAKYALLKARSPSCGVHFIYDGTFTHTLIPSGGLAAEALRAMGVMCFDETSIDTLIHALR